jgi:predicted SAM-dependent methyltransferase
VLVAIASHLVEHINPHKGGFIKFMDEVWRIMKPKGQFLIAAPHGSSQGYLQDPTHCNQVNEATWAYFDPIINDQPSPLYRIYRPKPWKIENLFWSPAGNMEISLRKRVEDKKYRK